ncbi:bacteriohemerythrin [Thiocystis violacea]|uniref:bacteriohemerythrin n=1 Tax=Thiocystis violacea TaxID=13725 RepID=UPI001905F39E|nr:hemerythrin domain-containing protein [Thiocystis violacea]MBK1717857.1 hemerythrin [Thiocystis violacea]
MPKLLTWREDWSLNIETLDRDHRALIDQLGDICLRFCPEASSGRAGNANALIEALYGLGESMREHFQREEDFMRAFDYAGIGEHQCDHALLMAEFTTLLREWRAEGLHVFDEASQGLVRDWLLAHILGADRTFVDAYFRLCGREISADRGRAMNLYQSSYRFTLAK